MTRLYFLLTPLFLIGCATAAVDMNEPRRVVGTTEGVRVDAMVTGDTLKLGGHVAITCEVTNQRSGSIAVADLIPETSFDSESGLVTVSVGSELPGQTLLPRLIEIPPGQKRTITTSARIGFSRPRSADPFAKHVAELRLKVNFLADTAPFTSLIGLSERAVADPELADRLFPVWVENNEVIYTNTLPMRWAARATDQPEPPASRRRPF